MQCAAIPYRWTQNGGLDILLVTARGKRRGKETWIIPKGKVKPGKSAAISAAEEAYEEAGARGTLDQALVARFDLPLDGRKAPEQMQIFALEVEEQAMVWPEMFQRQRRWASLAEALEMLKAPHFRQALQAFAAMMAPLV
jgi:8-oxo-dGTP pyrophosphatase MutT (NUDIX family)